MACTAIIQARMGSSRLPGKILKPLAGQPALFHVVDRLHHCTRLERIVVATTTSSEDDQVENFCRDHKILFFRGSEQDVLDRYYQAARVFKADPIVRVTADCPVIDPMILDGVISGFFEGGYDVYGLTGEFPDGLDCTVFSFKTLETTWKNARLPSEREHVGPYMSKNPQLFKQGGYEPLNGLQHLRWTLDEPADYEFLSTVFDRLYDPDEIFLYQDILDLLEQDPSLQRINSHIVRNEGYLKSLEKDRKVLEKHTTKTDVISER